MGIMTPKRTGSSLFVVAMLATTGLPASGQTPAEPGPLITDRPDHTESPVAIAPGWLQLEAGYSLEREGEITTHNLGETLARFGLVPRLEFRLGFPSVQLDREAGETIGGLADITLGLKWQLTAPGAEPGWTPGLALIGAVSLPTGSADVRALGAEPEAILAAGWILTPRLALGSNLSWVGKEDDDGRFDQFGASAVMAYGLLEPLGVFFEYFGEFPSGSGRDLRNFLDTGLTHLICADFQIDARIGLALDGPSPGYFVGAGLVWRTR